MENPKKEIKDVVRGLVCNPTLKQQAEVIQKYFTQDVQFRHIYINYDGGMKNLTTIYHIGEILFRYQDVDFLTILYDETENAMALQMLVHTKPVLQFWRIVSLRIFVLLKLVDVQEGGRTVKKIKEQWDYFERAPVFQMIPVIGQIYDSDAIRYVAGRVMTAGFEVIRQVLDTFAPVLKKSAFMGVGMD